MSELILKLVLAHLLGDFIFQRKWMVTQIDERGYKAPALYIHVLQHLALLLLVTGFKKEFVFPVVLLAIAHLLIDMFTKVALKGKQKSLVIFSLDQLLHAASIMLVVNYFYPIQINTDLLFGKTALLLYCALIAVSFGSAFTIRKIIELFNYPPPENGLKDAGTYIGIIERLFVFGFVVGSFWPGIGFLLAAKSVFRFGDLRENKDQKLTEYMLIGTLLSFGFAILIGLVFLFLGRNL